MFRAPDALPSALNALHRVFGIARTVLIQPSTYGFDNYIWNSNDLILNSTSSDTNAFYVQRRSSSQHSLVFDLLVYFRDFNSRVRPYFP